MNGLSRDQAPPSPAQGGPKEKVQSNPTLLTMLQFAAWFGLVTGLGEALLFIAFQASGRIMFVWYDILWIAPLFDLVPFLAVALSLSLAARLFRRLPLQSLAVFSSSTLMLLNWLLLSVRQLIAYYTSETVAYYTLFLVSAAVGLDLAHYASAHWSTAIRLVKVSTPWAAASVLIAFVGIHSVDRLGGLTQRATERPALSASGALPAGTEAPSILVIVSDSLRADHLSSYGYARKTSPNLDRIAASGVSFENAISASSYSLPSHASLFTGLYPYQHGAEWATPKALASGSYPTLAEVLQAGGYRTGGFSANVFWVTREHGFGRGFDHFEDYFTSAQDMFFRTIFGRVFENLVMRRLGYADIPARKEGADITRAALDWIGEDTRTPFFVFLNYMDTHDPYLPPQPYRSKFSAIPNPGGLLNWRVGLDHPKLTAEQLQSEIDAYDGAVSYVDDSVQQLLDGLQQRGFRNLLVIFTADHGEAFGEHQLYLHGTSLYMEEIHVPLIISWPGHVPAGARIQQPVSNAALPATIMEMLASGKAGLFQGPALTQLWEAPTPPAEWPNSLSEIAQQPWTPAGSPVHEGSMKSLVGPEWHLITHEKLGAELYAWLQDPLERINMSMSPQAQQVKELFQQILRRIP